MWVLKKHTDRGTAWRAGQRVGSRRMGHLRWKARVAEGCSDISHRKNTMWEVLTARERARESRWFLKSSVVPSLSSVTNTSVESVMDVTGFMFCTRRSWRTLTVGMRWLQPEGPWRRTPRCCTQLPKPFSATQMLPPQEPIEITCSNKSRRPLLVSPMLLKLPHPLTKPKATQALASWLLLWMSLT